MYKDKRLEGWDERYFSVGRDECIREKEMERLDERCYFKSWDERCIRGKLEP